jgi:hypothetical protein
VGAERVNKLCTNGIFDSSRSLRGSPSATMPFAALSSTMQWLATRKMLGSSWVTMTMVMPRSRLSVRMSSSSSAAEIGSSPADGSSKNSRSASRHQGTSNARPLFHAPRNFAWEVFRERTKPDEIELSLDKFLRSRSAYRGPSGQGESEVLRECH